VFDLASLTKVIATTTAVMQLVEQGKVRMNDPVAKYLPEFAQNGKEDITVRQLMTHYSGLAPDLDLTTPWEGKNTAYQLAFVEPPETTPGSGFVYSDINFIMLGALVERVSGETLDTYATQHIFAPLKMTRTRFVPPAAWRAKIAPTQYDENEHMLRGVVHDPTARRMGGVAGHAGLFAPAADLARFAAWWVSTDDAVVPATLRRAAATCQTGSPGGRRGYGWACPGDAFDILGGGWPPTAVSHTGFTGTSLALDPPSGVWVVLLTNAVHAGRDATAVKALRRAVHEAVRVLQGPYRPDLDLAEPGHRVRGGHLHGLLEAGALEHVVPADDLLGLGERPVADQDLTVAN
jgi:CubicO group peptidase (beta-lactamase class C family)